MEIKRFNSKQVLFNGKHLHFMLHMSKNGFSIKGRPTKGRPTNGRATKRRPTQGRATKRRQKVERQNVDLSKY